MTGRKFTGVVFDFNGTLFWDTHLHNKAWDQFLYEHKISISDDDKSRFIHGKTNREILNLLFKTILPEESFLKYNSEKEIIYQELCRNSNLYFAPGALDFVDFLKKKNVDYAIATSSGINNIEFYLSYLGLEKWFRRDRIIYNQGNMKSKPDPEIFAMAINRLNRKPGEVIIFEDSFAGIQSAESAGAGKIIIVNSNGDDYSTYNYPVITGFDMVNKSLFGD
jgi:beta-phosphoglucomutase